MSSIHRLDTVIIGGGPSSLILSYILHGHVPHYTGRHHDPILHRKLSGLPSLLHIPPSAHAHFSSNLRYSTQALPVNTLFDTLVRPNADTEVNPESHVEWRPEPQRAVSHVVLTNADRPGGQWASDPADAGWDIGTLSYSEMLSLPGYSYAENFRKLHGRDVPDFERPSRTEVAEYFAAYPAAVGIQDAVRTSTVVLGAARSAHGFVVTLDNGQALFCRHLVLGTGIYTQSIKPSPMLSALDGVHDDSKPLLVIGSGFSAADVIISAPPTRKIIHVYRWNPEKRPSPLRGCHHQAYPEYAGVYRQMKLAAISGSTQAAASPLSRRKGNPFLSRRDWASLYDGYPNSEVEGVKTTGKGVEVCLRLESGDRIWREVGGLAFVVGRHGSLAYLAPELLAEVLGSAPPPPSRPSTAGGGSSAANAATAAAVDADAISGRTLRAKAELSTEVAPGVFIIGSLTGDSLVRHAYGGCVVAACHILDTCSAAAAAAASSSQNGLTNGNGKDIDAAAQSGHLDLHLDRREVVTLASEVEGGG